MTPPADLERQILDLLSDGVARTFNRIAVELWDLTADTVLDTAADQALWRLVGPALGHTLEAPVFFRVQPELLADAQQFKVCVPLREGEQLGIDFLGLSCLRDTSGLSLRTPQPARPAGRGQGTPAAGWRRPWPRPDRTWRGGGTQRKTPSAMFQEVTDDPSNRRSKQP